MATLPALRTAIKDTLDAGFTAAGVSVNVYKWVVDNPQPPCVLVTLADPAADFVVAMGRGADTWNFDLVVLVPSASLASAQETLDPYLSGSGATSVRQILFTTPAGSPRSLGLSNTDAHAANLTKYGLKYPAAGNEYVGAVVRLVVHTIGTA